MSTSAAAAQLMDGPAGSSAAMLPLQVLSPSGSPGQMGPLTLMSPSLLLNQPIFVAISTNPLILVPCSYNATTGGLNFAGSSQPVLPAVSLSGQQAATFPNHVSSQRHSKGSRTLSSSPHSSPPLNAAGTSSPAVDQPLDLTSKPFPSSKDQCNPSLEQVVKNITLANQNHAVNHSTVGNEATSSRIERRRNSNAIVIAPGSSFLNKPPHHSPFAHHDHDTTTDDNNSRSSCCSPPQVHSLNMPIPGLPAPGHMGMIGPAAAGALVASGVSMERHGGLVKQGTFRCKDCNIVFFKHENFLVHKSMYCASRRSSDMNNVSSPSPEPPESDHAPNSSPDITIDSKPLPVPSPTRSVTSTPPHGSPPPPLAQHHPPVFQFFCVACGIRFTSLDTLQAHQAFYCLKRSAVGSQAAKGSAENGTVSNGCDTKSLPDDNCDRIAPVASALPPAASSKSCHSQSNLQAFKCTICGYKGHTMRGMRTHVRIHQDKMQGLSEESFIEYMDETQAVVRKTSATGPGSRSRRRSLEPAAAAQDRQSPAAKRRRPVIPSLRYN
jgi:zinc finger protein ZFPM1